MKKKLLTKGAVCAYLERGMALDALFDLSPGQECEIFKADAFRPGNEILYIPDVSLNGIATYRTLDFDEIEDVLNCCYTGDDFLKIAEGDEEKAEELFRYVDWQHPSSAWDAGELDDDAE